MSRRLASFARPVATIGVLAALALTPGLAQGERAQSGNLIVSLDSTIAPLQLPRDHPAPVGVRLAGEIRTVAGAPLPRVKRIELALAGQGLLSTRGLPVCPRARLRNATNQQAIERCGPALVGHGRLSAEAFVPQQAPFGVNARLFAFNGRTGGGRTAVWVHAYATDPPVSIDLPFVVKHRPGPFGTELVTNVPRSVGSVPHLSSFEMVFSRRFSYRGERHSYLSASCPLPPHFTAGFFSFARATYAFAGGKRLSTETVRSCRAR